MFERMYASGNRAKIRAEGFSLLDMRRYLRSVGYEADGFELPLDKLLEEGVPAIVLLNDRGYRHFVVVKGLRGGADFDAELPMALMNRHLAGVETVFVAGDASLLHVASSLVKDIARHGGPVGDLVPAGVEDAVRRALGPEQAST